MAVNAGGYQQEEIMDFSQIGNLLKLLGSSEFERAKNKLKEVLANAEKFIISCRELIEAVEVVVNKVKKGK